MDIAQIVAIGIITTVLSLVIKERAPEFALVTGIAGSVIIFIMVLPMLSSIIDVFENIMGQASTNISYLYTVFKIIGIAYIAEFGAQICLDAGESAIASKIELGGKVIVMFVSAPILISLLDLIMTIMPG